MLNNIKIYPSTEFLLEGSRQTVIENIIKLTPKEREQIGGMEKGRTDIINAGLAPLTALLTKSDAPYIVISNNSIREGIAYEMLI